MDNNLYSIFINPGNFAADTIWSKTYLTELPASFKINLTDDAGNNEAVPSVFWVAIETGEHDINSTVHIKCGYSTVVSNGYIINFTTPFDNNNYVALCTAANTTADTVLCTVRGNTRTNNGFTIDIQNDADGLTNIQGVRWCAMTPGQYTIDGINIFAGRNLISWVQQTIPFETDFFNFIPITSHTDNGDLVDPASCEVVSSTTHSFDVLCEDDGGDTGQFAGAKARFRRWR